MSTFHFAAADGSVRGSLHLPEDQHDAAAERLAARYGEILVSDVGPVTDEQLAEAGL